MWKTGAGPAAAMLFSPQAHVHVPNAFPHLKL